MKSSSQLEDSKHCDRFDDSLPEIGPSSSRKGGSLLASRLQLLDECDGSALVEPWGKQYLHFYLQWDF